MDNLVPNRDNCILGDALYEVYVANNRTWFKDASYTATSSSGPFYERGGGWNSKIEAGIFCSSGGHTGVEVGNNSFRVCLPGAGITSKDSTRPVMTVSPSSTEGAVKSSNITISITDPGYSSGIASGNSYHYFLSPSKTNPREDGYVEGEYTNGTTFSIGNGLTGTYYLYVQQIFDNFGNGNVTNITDGNTKYYKVGPYIFDNSAPTITSVITSNPGENSFQVSITASDIGNAGIATSNAYTIYYKQSKEVTYKTITTTNNIYTISNLIPKTEDIDITTMKANIPTLTDGMNPVIWVDKDGDGVANNEIEKYTSLNSKTINSEWNKYDGDKQWSYYNKASALYEVHVVVEDSLGNRSEESEDIQQEIYPKLDHKTSHFGNVKMEDGSYFVWIPRYAYRITKAPSTVESNTNAGTVEVKFINGTGNIAYDGTICTIATSKQENMPNNIDSTSQYVVHPAFCEDVNMGGFEENLKGIWVAKYESGREDSKDGVTWKPTTEAYGGENKLTTNALIATGGTEEEVKIRVVSKPNVMSWRYITIGNCFTNGYYYNQALSSHLIKNSEWGAVAYLTHSTYGRNGNEISRNDSYYAGSSKGSPTEGGSVETGTYKYDTVEGMLASTSGNIYGIYDLSGGAYEYVAAWDTKSTSDYITRCGSSFASKGGSSTKYATAYYNGVTSSEIGYRYPRNNQCILGDATYEVNVNMGKSNWAWFYDYSYCANANAPFFLRGGRYDYIYNTGVFCSNDTYGYSYGDASFRIVLPGE